MYDIDVNGTQAVLQAASEAGTEQVLVTSSASAYGAFPDNPVPIAEDQPVRGQPDFSYARDKAEADRICQLWAADHADRVMTIVRPTIVFGPNVDNYISRAMENSTFLPVMDGIEADVQFVHEDDIVTAISGLLDGRDSAETVAEPVPAGDRRAVLRYVPRPHARLAEHPRRRGSGRWFSADLHVLGEGEGRLFTSFAVIGGITYNFFPFMALPFYVSLEQIDPRLLEAAKDLYATPRQAFLRVTLPLSAPGIVAGTLLTFIPAAGDFINAGSLGTPNQR